MASNAGGGWSWWAATAANLGLIIRSRSAPPSTDCFVEFCQTLHKTKIEVRLTRKHPTNQGTPTNLGTIETFKLSNFSLCIIAFNKSSKTVAFTRRSVVAT